MQLFNYYSHAMRYIKTAGKQVCIFTTSKERTRAVHKIVWEIFQENYPQTRMKGIHYMLDSHIFCNSSHFFHFLLDFIFCIPLPPTPLLNAVVTQLEKPLSMLISTFNYTY